MDLSDVFTSILPNKKYIERFVKIVFFGLCYGCVFWQSVVCYDKYVSQPTGAQIDLVSSEIIPVSFTFCKTIYNLHANILDEDIQLLQELDIIFNKEESQSILTSEELLKYDFVAVKDEQYLCKEIPLPKKNIESVKVVHSASSQNQNFHLFIHPQNMFLQAEMVVQYSNEYFHKGDGQAMINFEIYDLSKSSHIQCVNGDYHQCQMKNIIHEYNRTLGCSYPIQRYLIQFSYYIL